MGNADGMTQKQLSAAFFGWRREVVLAKRAMAFKKGLL
ncbi:hypothetical protein VTH8203_04715 [Vibrio thalassae]|uniref:Uncharacterized protein n=1 Tax=Vibrio thalassae TaxID=1243014 RepID=A0A240EQQ7_9VIBR|nr:hypothetical protein VTH8203_04715 [Vibrio thalassae]